MVTPSPFAGMKNIFKDVSGNRKSRSSLENETSSSLNPPQQGSSSSAPKQGGNTRNINQQQTKQATPRRSSLTAAQGAGEGLQQPPPYQNHHDRPLPAMPQRSASHGVEESSLKRYPNHHGRGSSTSLTDDYQAYLNLDAPAPPAHRDTSSSTRSSSAGDSSSSVNKTILPKSAVRRNQVSMLLNELDQIKLQSTQQTSDLEHRHQELERAFLAKEKEYNKISTNFHQLVKTIRATDDDFSTIRVKLAMLQSKTAALPLSLKKYDASTSRDVFAKRWPHLKADIARLYGQRGAGATCILVEKLLFEVFVDRIFNTPVYIGLPTNAAYEAIREYMDPHNTDWSLRLRQQLCKLAAKSMQADDQVNQAIVAAKEALVKDLESFLGDIYTNECKDALAGKVHKLVDIAADVSLAMHSQDTSVEVFEVNEALLSDPDLMQSVDAFAADSSGQVRIVVSPPFVAEEPSEKLVLLRGKGIVC